MPVKTNINTLEKLLKVVKPFIGKSQTRPALTLAQVTPTHIVATDAMTLIRIEHNEDIQETYLHDFSKNPMDTDSVNYPQTERIIPDPLNAKTTLVLDVKEWLDSHKLGKIASKTQDKKNELIQLIHGDTLSVKKNENLPSLDQMGFIHTLFKNEQNLEIDVHYNCSFMIKALNALKQLKHKTATLYFYGPQRPMLLKAENVEIIVLPIRVNR